MFKVGIAINERNLKKLHARHIIWAKIERVMIIDSSLIFSVARKNVL